MRYRNVVYLFYYIIYLNKVEFAFARLMAWLDITHAGNKRMARNVKFMISEKSAFCYLDWIFLSKCRITFVNLRMHLTKIVV